MLYFENLKRVRTIHFLVYIELIKKTIHFRVDIENLCKANYTFLILYTYSLYKDYTVLIVYRDYVRTMHFWVYYKEFMHARTIHFWLVYNSCIHNWVIYKDDNGKEKIADGERLIICLRHLHTCMGAWKKHYWFNKNITLCKPLFYVSV